jgi:retron-type reverse transcriptase
LKAITKGVPQGSILGPIIFNIFMNDLSYVIEQSTLFSYADDTQIFKSAENINDVEHDINIDLENVDKWYEKNQMKRNPAFEISSCHLWQNR